MPADPMLRLAGVVKTFGGERRLFGWREGAVHAVRGISFDLAEGETLGLVGESGCGKSTLARMVVGLEEPTAGTVELLSIARSRSGRAVSYVFQDPVASLNPRKTVGAALDVPLRRLLRMERSARATRRTELLDTVGLEETFAERYPHELSGGQAQRVAIARALAGAPRLLVLDEPVSALDVSMQAQVLALLAELKGRFALTYLFISHDLSVVESVSDRVAILYFGKLVEIGPARQVFASPHHPYTDLLMRSAPAPGRRIAATPDEDGALPDPYDPPKGCAFAPRCPRAKAVCETTEPPLTASGSEPAQQSACHFPLNPT